MYVIQKLFYTRFGSDTFFTHSLQFVTSFLGTLQYEDLSIDTSQCSEAVCLLPFRYSHKISAISASVSFAIINDMKMEIDTSNCFFQNKDSSDRVKFRNIGKVFKKSQPPKKVNRPSDRKLKKKWELKIRTISQKWAVFELRAKKGIPKRA